MSLLIVSMFGTAPATVLAKRSAPEALMLVKILNVFPTLPLVLTALFK